VVRRARASLTALPCASLLVGVKQSSETTPKSQRPKLVSKVGLESLVENSPLQTGRVEKFLLLPLELRDEFCSFNFHGTTTRFVFPSERLDYACEMEASYE